MRLSILLTLFVCCLFSLPSSSQRLIDTAKISRLKLTYSGPRTKFRFLKEKHIERTNSELVKVDTNAYYLVKEIDSETKDTTSGFIRFFSNGVAFISLKYGSKIDASEFEQTTYGRFFAYKVRGRELVIEGFDYNSSPHYYLLYYRISDNGNLTLYQRRIGRSPLNSKMKMSAQAVKVPHYFQSYKINWH